MSDEGVSEMTTKRYRVGIAGVGHGHVSAHLRGWKEVGQAEVVAIADDNVAERQEYLRRLEVQGVREHDAIETMLATEELDIIEEVGLETIASESRRRTAWMVEFALEQGWRLNSPADIDERGGSVMIGVEDAPQMVARLAGRKVFVDWRPQVGLRISPHFFNTDGEVREALEILKEVMSDE